MPAYTYAQESANDFVLAQTIDVDFLTSYEYQVLELALEKTREKYGEYNLSISRNILSEKRAELVALSDENINLFFIDSASIERSTSLAYAHFPVMLGIVGYRVAIVRKDLKLQGYAYNTVNDLKKYTFIQGEHWLDGKVLKDNGFNVLESSSVEGLFNMLSYGRADFFPLGANQLKDTLEENIDIKNLSIEEKFVLYYPLPRFFYTHKRNKTNVKRVEEGLKLAFEDGSLISLWYKHNKASLDFVNLDERVVYKLKNSHLGELADGLEQYVYPFNGVTTKEVSK